MTGFSVLDLCAVVEGSSVPEALARTVATASTAEDAGYDRLWVAEHHSMPGVASAATALVIQHVAAHTSAIRVGAGGIMLPNHPPLVIAEQFGTLDALFPGRIDLGLGRAPGTDGPAAQALRHRPAGADAYPADVVELLWYLAPARPDAAVIAVPGAGCAVPVWILGSSPFSAQLAARLGLPYAFAAHFAPQQLMTCLALYHQQFRPGRTERPRTLIAVNAIVADTEAEAHFLATTQVQLFAELGRGGRPVGRPPTRDLRLSPLERSLVDRALAASFVGTAAQVHDALRQFRRDTQADELMIHCAVFDHALRQRSLARTIDA